MQKNRPSWGGVGSRSVQEGVTPSVFIIKNQCAFFRHIFVMFNKNHFYIWFKGGGAILVWQPSAEVSTSITVFEFTMDGKPFTYCSDG